MGQVYGGCEAVAGGGLSVSRAFDGTTEEPLVMLTCESPRGGIIVLYPLWEQAMDLRVGLHGAVGMLASPFASRINQGGFLGFDPFDPTGLLAFVARHQDGRVCALTLDANGAWSLLCALSAFLEQNHALLEQRRAASLMRHCVQCGTAVPLDQAVLVRQVLIDDQLTIAPLALSDPGVMICCSSACAEARQQIMFMQQVLERAGPRPSCAICGEAATWIDPLREWICGGCGATVKEK